MWWEFSSLFVENKDYCSEFNAKSKGGRGRKLHLTFVGTHKQMVGNQYGGCGLSIFMVKHTLNITHFEAKFAGFILGWKGLPNRSMHITIQTNS